MLRFSPLLGSLLLVLGARVILAQEVIQDPENPRYDWGQRADDDRGSEPETIFDPENPMGPRPEQRSQPTSELATTISPQSWFAGTYLGRFYFDTRIDNNLEDIFLLDNRLELRARVELSEHFRAVVEGRLEHWLWGESNPQGADFFVNGRDFQGYFEASLRDAYVASRFGRFFLTVGNQSVVWGAGTLSQPAAVINPIDYRRGVFETPADRRLPSLAAAAALTAGRFSVSAVVVPFFEPHKFDVRGSDFAIFDPSRGPSTLSFFDSYLPDTDPSVEPSLGDSLVITERPEAVPENVSCGARLFSAYGGVDVGLGYFYGWDRIPFFVRERGGDEDDRDFTSTYLRRHTVEADLVTYLGRVGIRLEGSFSPERTVYVEEDSATSQPGRADEDTVPEARRLPVLSTAAALSYERSESLTVQLEGTWRHVFEVSRDTAGALLDVDAFGILFLFRFGLDEIRALRGRWLDALSVSVSGLLNLTSRDSLLFATATWSLSDAADLSIGLQQFTGPDPDAELTLGGLFDRNDQAFVSFQFTF